MPREITAVEPNRAHRNAQFRQSRSERSDGASPAFDVVGIDEDVRFLGLTRAKRSNAVASSSLASMNECAIVPKAGTPKSRSRKSRQVSGPRRQQSRLRAVRAAQAPKSTSCLPGAARTIRAAFDATTV